MSSDLMALARSGTVHFMGVGGAGMCALAELVLRAGGSLSGCDLEVGASARRLRELGATVTEGHAAGHVEEATGLVVTAAVPEDHPEIERARARGIPVLKRAEALGAVVNAGTVVAVAGSHGKTTTTAMTTEVLEAAGLEPTGLVGGTVPAWGGNLRHGGDLYVVEADEYDRSFLSLSPDVAVVTNVDADHLEVYGDLEGVQEAFGAFLERLRGGDLVACADDPGAARLLPRVADATTYGRSAGSQVRGLDVRLEGGVTYFRVAEHGRDRGDFRLSVPGDHNLLNALAAAATARALGVDWDAIRRGLAEFDGVSRRFQRLGEAGGVEVVDDYAHHPTEARATLGALRERYPERRLVVLFQPHLFSRTRDFADAFGDALAEADVLWVTDVFPAREAPIEGVDGSLVARAARAAGAPDVRHHASLEGVDAAVVDALDSGDVVVTMGAGSISAVGPKILERLGGPDA